MSTREMVCIPSPLFTMAAILPSGETCIPRGRSPRSIDDPAGERIHPFGSRVRPSSILPGSRRTEFVEVGEHDTIKVARNINAGSLFIATHCKSFGNKYLQQRFLSFPKSNAHAKPQRRKDQFRVNLASWREIFFLCIGSNIEIDKLNVIRFFVKF